MLFEIVGEMGCRFVSQQFLQFLERHAFFQKAGSLFHSDFMNPLVRALSKPLLNEAFELTRADAKMN